MHVRSAWSPAPALPSVSRAWPTWALVAFGGSALALADLGFACVYWFLHSGVAPMRIAQAIASWVVGSQVARAGGVDAAIAGTLLYCACGAAMVALYLRITAWWPRLHAHVLVAGAVFGVAMYGLLFQVIVPYLSAATISDASSPVSWTLGCLVAYAGIGIGCASIARRNVTRNHAR